MVKLTSFMALSTLVIAPTFAAVLPIIETRDVAQLQVFGRDMGGLFAREQDFELPDLTRRFLSEAEDTSELVRRDVYDPNEKHKPFVKHHLEELDPELDNPPIPVINDDDLDY